MPITVTHADKIAVLNLGDDENRFSMGFLDDVDRHLDEIVASGADGLVTTGTGKFYSNGLDLEFLAPLGGKDPGTLGAIKTTMFAAAVSALDAG